MSQPAAPSPTVADWCPGCATRCRLHGLRACAICHRHEGQCDFGACQRPAVYVADFAWETRAFCQTHATDPRFSFARHGARSLEPIAGAQS